MNEKAIKIKVLFIITDLGKGGAERYLIDLCSTLQSDNRFEFKIVTLYDNNQYVELTDDFEIVSVDYRPFSLFHKNGTPLLEDVINKFKPDIVHTHRYLAEFASSLYLIPSVIYICHGHDKMVQLSRFHLSTLFSKIKFLNFIERHYLIKKKYQRIPTYFIANSIDTENYYKENLPPKSLCSVNLIQYGFNFKRFFYPTKQGLTVGKPIRILNVGSFQKKKNQIFIVDIARSLKKRGISFTIDLIGNGEEFDQVKGAIKEYSLEKEVFLRGVIDNVEEWYKGSDIYLHTAWYEPFGLVFLEAMAAGLPIVCLDGKGNRDIIVNRENGFIFYKEDPEMFADAIELLSKDCDLYLKISTFAKNFASNFDFEIKNNELKDFYISLMKRREINVKYD